MPMINDKECPMKRLTMAEWHEWRLGGIGGSDAPAVMGRSPWATPRDVWAQKTRRAAGPKQTPAMKRGIELEDPARAEYERMTGISAPALLIEHATLPFIRASLDGINDEARRVLEIKCPGKKDHAEARAGRIPEKYLWQCVHLLLVTGYERLDYFSFDGQRGVIVPFERDETLEQRLVQAETWFWRYVVDDVPPPGASAEQIKLERAKSRERALAGVAAQVAAAASNIVMFPIRRSR
jgi:putative phage-type endonuclease